MALAQLVQAVVLLPSALAGFLMGSFVMTGPSRAEWRSERLAFEGGCQLHKVLDHVSTENGKVTSVFRKEGSQPIVYNSGMAIDADGAPDAYHPRQSKGLDSLVHAGTPGDWWALLTDDEGEPIVRDSGPYRGFYVSMTWLHHHDRTMSRQDPDYWVDARSVPYLAIPESVWSVTGVTKGDLAVVLNERNGNISPAIVADWGTEDTLGEGSIALGRALGLRSSDPRTGGVRDGITYVVFPNSAASPAWPRAFGDIQSHAYALFQEWGGGDALRACMRHLG